MIGTDFSMYTRWRNASGSSYSQWVNQQGHVKEDFKAADFKLLKCGSQSLLFLKGEDNRWYWNGRRTDGTWTGFRLGDSVACPA